MTYPASDVVTTNLDAGSDNAATARADLLDLATKFNQLRNHVSAFMQAALAWADAAAGRLGLGLANHQLVTVDASGNVATNAGANVSVSNNLSAGGTATFTGQLNANGGSSVTGNEAVSGNITAGGSITASGNVTAYSDERLKTEWAGLPAEFVERLADVRAGTFKRLDSAQRFAGVSAQSLQQLLPEAVVEDEKGVLSVAYGNAALVACVALAQEVVELREQVRHLKESR